MKSSRMIKSLLPLIGLLSVSTLAEAQYYYKDIVSNKQLLAEMATLKDQKIRTVSVKSFESDGSPSEGFFCDKKISKNYRSVEMFTRSDVTGPSLFTSTFNNKGLLIQTNDSSDISSNTTMYEYDEQDRISSIRTSTRSSDDDFTNEIAEEHRYIYDKNGLPSKMLYIRNSGDTSTILFSLDEKKNIAIEKNTKSGDTYYYYYDGANRLTDIVKLNPFNQKMLPDYMFEYNGAGLVTQMTTTEEGGNNYYIWKYTYANGLMARAKCFSKDKRLMGSFDYEYQ